MISTFYNTALHSSKSFLRKLPCSPLEPYCTGLWTGRGNRQFKLEQDLFSQSFIILNVKQGNVSLIFNEWLGWMLLPVTADVVSDGRCGRCLSRGNPLCVSQQGTQPAQWFCLPMFQLSIEPLPQIPTLLH